MMADYRPNVHKIAILEGVNAPTHGALCKTMDASLHRYSDCHVSGQSRYQVLLGIFKLAALGTRLVMRQSGGRAVCVCGRGGGVQTLLSL